MNIKTNRFIERTVFSDVFITKKFVNKNFKKKTVYYSKIE